MTPLAERIRPTKIEDFIGQEHVLAQGTPLRNAIDSGAIYSFIIWGPPGVGKTSLANIIANQLKRAFYKLSAISSGVKQLREVIEKASKQDKMGFGSPILFIDEIHRFNKSQQDSLLAAVEKGIITLIGATTENPSFEVNSALLSRCEVYTFDYLNKKQLLNLIEKAKEKDEWLKNQEVEYKEIDLLLKYSGGDGRKLLNQLEMVINFQKSALKIIDNQTVENALKNQTVFYDKNGEQHYDIVSAFIKSLRGSDPQASLYWMARMIAGGEDPKFIARRMLILASEDIGLANPTAMVMANSCFQAVQAIGWPECRIILSQTAIYLANSPKSNSAYTAIDDAIAAAKEDINSPVPLHLRNAPTKLMKDLGYGKDYLYAHNHPGNFIPQDFMPENRKGQLFYKTANNQKEEQYHKVLKNKWKGYYEY